MRLYIPVAYPRTLLPPLSLYLPRYFVLAWPEGSPFFICQLSDAFNRTATLLFFDTLLSDCLKLIYFSIEGEYQVWDFYILSTSISFPPLNFSGLLKLLLGSSSPWQRTRKKTRNTQIGWRILRLAWVVRLQPLIDALRETSRNWSTLQTPAASTLSNCTSTQWGLGWLLHRNG